MPFFRYKAVSGAGEVQEGVLEAASSAAAIARVQAMGLIPIRADEAVATAATAPAAGARPALFQRRQVTQVDIGIMSRELATLLRAGLPLDRSFEILINLTGKPAMAELLANIRNEVRGGAALSKALESQKVFSRFYVNMIRAGEAGGSLPTVILRLAEYMERAKALRDTVTASLTYPALLAVVSIGAVVVLLGMVVPRFKPIFAGAGKAVPPMTQAVLWMGDAMRGYWWAMLIATVALVWLIARRLRDPDFRYRVDRWLVTGPIVGSLFARIEMARFSRTLGTLLTNGVTLVGALNIVRETMGNAWLAEAVGGVARELKEGRGLGRPMMETGRFPMLAVHMIQVGEETGRLDDMLMQVAQTYDREVETAIQKMLALLQPMVIILMAGIIAFIIYAIMSAMLSVYDLPF